ncbi:MAG: ornithine cyclodeaminase family protein [Burkholderiales bacterium]
MPFWFSEADVTASLTLKSAIGALQHVLAAEAQGQATNMTKTHLMVGKNDVLQAFGGSVAAEGLCGTKTWVNIAGKSQTVLILFSLTDGSLRAVFEATALGQMRTAAMSGVGTDWMARADADELAIIGTGKQALPQIAAVVAVRSIKRVRIFSRTTESREKLAKEVRRVFPAIEVTPAPTMTEALDGAPIVTLCTNAQEPFYTTALAKPGTHINAVGAIVPARSEFTEDVFARCTSIAVDTVEGVKELSREFIDYFGAGREPWTRVLPISQVIARGQRRPANADLTLFKAMGMGIADIAVAIEVLKAAETRGIGQRLPERVRQELPLAS